MNYKDGGIVNTGNFGKAQSNINKAVINSTKDKALFSKKTKAEAITRRLGLSYVFNDDSIHLEYVKTGADAFGLKADGKNSIYLGKSQIRNSTRRQKISKSNYYALSRYSKYKEIFDHYEVDVNKNVVVNGCFKTNKHTIQDQMTPIQGCDLTEYPTVENCAYFDDAIKTVFRKLSFIPDFSACDISEMLFQKIAKDKKPGFRYEECLKMPDKATAAKRSYSIARRRWNYLTRCKTEELKHSKMVPGVYSIGARNKRDYTYEPGEVATSRVVHMPEMHQELVSGCWINKVSDFIKEIAKGPIYIGNSILQWHRLNKDISKTAFVLEGDWKRFDSTLYIIIITCALALVRCLFTHRSRYVDNHFIAIFDSIIIKDYYIPGGSVFRVFHGLPSGVTCTSLLGSVVNLIALVQCVGPEISKKFRFIVGGDDFLVACTDESISATSIMDKMEKEAIEIGMKFKFIKNKNSESESLDDRPVFYKYTIWNGKPVVPVESILERVFMPWNRRVFSSDDYIEFLWNLMPSLGYPMSHHYLYYDILSYMHWVITGRSLPIKNIFETHLTTFKKMTSRSISRKQLKIMTGEEDPQIRLFEVLRLKQNRSIRGAQFLNELKFDVKGFKFDANLKTVF